MPTSSGSRSTELPAREACLRGQKVTTTAVNSGSRSCLSTSCEGALFVERLPVLEAVVQLAEEAVEEVALGGVVPVAVLASAAVVGVGSG